MIHGVIQDVVVNGATIISALVLSIINRKHQHVDKGGVTNEIRWRMLSGKSRYPEHLPLLSRAAAIFWVGYLSFYHFNNIAYCIF